MKPDFDARRKFRDDVVAFALKTSAGQAAVHFNLKSRVVRAWVQAHRERYGDPPPPEAPAALEVPEAPAVNYSDPSTGRRWVDVTVTESGEVETVARSPDSIAADTLLALFTRIGRSAATAPLKEVIAATSVVGELILAANITNQSFARRLAAAADGLDGGEG